MTDAQYIAALEISTAQPPFHEFGLQARSAIESADQNAEQAFFSNQAVVSFVAGVFPDFRQDVLDSTLLAQLAADKAYPEKRDLEGWYRKYTEVLSRTGWVVQSATDFKDSSGHGVVEMENVIVDVLTAALGGNYVVIIKNVLQALKGLSDSDNKIIAFEKKTHTVEKGAVQLAVASQDSTNKTIALTMGSFVLESKNEIRRILFFKSSKDNTRLAYSTLSGTLNPDVYHGLRAMVKAKLGQQAMDFITEIDL